MKIKLFHSAQIETGGVQCVLVTEMRLVIVNPKPRKDFVTHVEADESAYDPWPAWRAGASHHPYTERASNDG